MIVSRIGALLLLQSGLCYVTQEKNALTPCKVNDLECFKKSLEMFLDFSAKRPQLLNLIAIDPLYVNEYQKNILEVPHIITDLVINGLENTKAVQYNMNTDSKTVSMQLDVSILADGDVSMNLTDNKYGTKLESAFSAELDFVASINYPFTIVNGKDDELHYEVGEEEISFRINNPSAVVFNDNVPTTHTDLARILTQDLVVVAMSTLVDNLRKAARELPTSAFIID